MIFWLILTQKVFMLILIKHMTSYQGEMINYYWITWIKYWITFSGMRYEW